MRLAFAVVADHADSTPEGKLDVHGVFHDLYAPGFPAEQGHLVLVVVVEWEHEDQGRYAFDIDLKDPEGRVALTVNGHTDVDPRPTDRPPARTRLLLPLEGVIFPIPGRYLFEIRIKGRTWDGPVLHLIEDANAGAAPPRAQ